MLLVVSCLNLAQPLRSILLLPVKTCCSSFKLTETSGQVDKRPASELQWTCSILCSLLMPQEAPHKRAKLTQTEPNLLLSLSQQPLDWGDCVEMARQWLTVNTRRGICKSGARFIPPGRPWKAAAGQDGRKSIGAPICSTLSIYTNTIRWPCTFSPSILSLPTRR